MAEARNPEVVDEVEALASIYPEDELTIRDLEGVDLTLRPMSDKVHVAVTLVVNFTEGYPNAVPELSFCKTKGLDDSQLQELKKVAEGTASGNIGMPAVFAVAEEVTEWLSINNKPPVTSMFDEMTNRAPQEEGSAPSDDDSDAASENVDVSKILAEKALVDASHRISEAQFQTWKVDFRLEMERTGIWAKRVDQSRPTGKSYFLTAPAAAIDPDDEDAEIAAVDGGPVDAAPTAGPVCWSNDALFTDDADLPDDLD